MGDKAPPLPYTSANPRTEHFPAKWHPVCREEMLEFGITRYWINEHPRSPRFGVWGAPPMEISR
jgi:hypothetical protein